VMVLLEVVLLVICLLDFNNVRAETCDIRDKGIIRPGDSAELAAIDAAYLRLTASDILAALDPLHIRQNSVTEDSLS
jgi:N-acyl-D-aspartate/D-glutamate deacylase